LRSYHRSGLTVEQCEDCRGIFLDGGELERLIDAEGGGWSGRIGPPLPWTAETSNGEPVSAGR
jgi:Zn-finger nucleic acid-binding protein